MWQAQTVAIQRIQAINDELKAAAERATKDRLRQRDLVKFLWDRGQLTSRNAVSTWWNGERTPERDLWPLIEEFFEMTPGQLGRLAAHDMDPGRQWDVEIRGADGTVIGVAEVKALPGAGPEAERQLAEVFRLVAEVTSGAVQEQFAIAARGADGVPKRQPVKRARRPHPPAEQGEHLED